MFESHSPHHFFKPLQGKDERSSSYFYRGMGKFPDKFPKQQKSARSVEECRGVPALWQIFDRFFRPPARELTSQSPAYFRPYKGFFNKTGGITPPWAKKRAKRADTPRSLSFFVSIAIGFAANLLTKKARTNVRAG